MGLRFESDLVQVGKVRYIASSNILAVNNNSFEDFPLGFLFCRENNQSQSTRTARAQASLNSNSIICSMSISPRYFFFKSILSHKTADGGDELLAKRGAIIGHAY